MRYFLIAAVVVGAGLLAPPTSAQIGLGLSIPEVAVRQRPAAGGGSVNTVLRTDATHTLRTDNTRICRVAGC